MKPLVLNQEKARIWRIIHRDNLPWILDHGLHCSNSTIQSSHWVSIGSTELIDKRAGHSITVPPYGRLSDYVPFYFTPYSVMMRNILSGRGGVQQRANDELLILVSSLHHINKLGLKYLFTDSHAYYHWANYYSTIDQLDKVDWPLLQSRDFKRDPDDPAKFERYQAEALIYQYCPVSALQGIICYTDALRQNIEQELLLRKIELSVVTRPGLYFT